jgi:hypothetical protein
MEVTEQTLNRQEPAGSGFAKQLSLCLRDSVVENQLRQHPVKQQNAGVATE